MIHLSIIEEGINDVLFWWHLNCSGVEEVELDDASANDPHIH